MRYEDSVKLEQLAAAAFDAKQAMDAHRMRNIYGLSYEEQKAAYIEMQMAEAQFAEAEGKLRKAHGQMIAWGQLRDE